MQATHVAAGIENELAERVRERTDDIYPDLVQLWRHAYRLIHYGGMLASVVHEPASSSPAGQCKVCIREQTRQPCLATAGGMQTMAGIVSDSIHVAQRPTHALSLHDAERGAVDNAH